MSNYLVSFGDSDKYEVDFPGNMEDFKKSDIVKGLLEKVDSYVKDKFPAASNIADVLPVNIEEADGKDYPKLDLTKIGDLLKNAVTQLGVEKFTDKLNLNAPFDKLGL